MHFLSWPFILTQQHGWWCAGDMESQSLNSHGIKLNTQSYILPLVELRGNFISDSPLKNRNVEFFLFSFLVALKTRVSPSPAGPRCSNLVCDLCKRLASVGQANEIHVWFPVIDLHHPYDARNHESSIRRLHCPTSQSSFAFINMKNR